MAGSRSRFDAGRVPDGAGAISGHLSGGNGVGIGACGDAGAGAGFGLGFMDASVSASNGNE